MAKTASVLFIGIICRFCCCLPMDDLSLEDRINSVIEEDEDLMRDLQSLHQQSYSSGENFPNDTSPQQVVDLMVKPYNKENPAYQLGNSNLADELLKNLSKVVELYNASILVENSSLVVAKKETIGENLVVLRIRGDVVIKVEDIRKAIPSFPMSRNDVLIEEYGNNSHHPTYATSCDVGDSEPLLLDEIRQLKNDGYLKNQMFLDVENGGTTAEDVMWSLLKDKDFVLAQFPEKLSEMLSENRIPPSITEKLFSGNFSLSELRHIVYYDDNLAKALLPDRLRELLEDRTPPSELKEMLYCGHNHTTMVGLTLRNKTLARKLMSESMFYFFTLFTVQRNIILNMAMSATTIVALTCVMTSLGCTMTIKEIMVHVRRPKGVLIALLSQYGVMPAAAFALTQAFGLGVYPAIAVLICGCCPGGNLSNILAFAINGDMNLSILMTTCSSVLGLAMMPLLLFCYSRFIIPIDGAEIVPFSKIVLNIVLTILPVSIGIAIKHYRPTWTKNVMRFGGIMLLLCSITFSVIAGFLLGDKFFSYFPTSVVYCAAILPISGYILGFLLARLVRENQRCSRTISVETGCQNVQLCGTVLKLAFDPVLIGAMMLLPIIYMLFQAGEAILLISIYRIYERLCGKKKTSDDDDEIKFDDEEKKFDSSDSEIKESDEDKISSLVENGKEKNKNGKTMNTDPNENWPLVPPDLHEAFENSKENYV